MSWLNRLAERRMQAARLKGQLQGLAGEGKPLPDRTGDAFITPGEAVEEKVSLSDRFGLWLGFHPCSQDDYLAIIAGYAAHHGLDWEQGDALEWSRRRGGRSGRVAWQYVTELAGRAGRSL